MINPDELVTGDYYFIVMYFRRNSAIPVIKTYIYLGKNIYPEEDITTGDEWFFQEAESYQKHGSFLENNEGKEYEVISVDKDVLTSMYDVSGLINLLQSKL